MSLALADYLIELANPGSLSRFQDDPETAMESAGLTEADKFALRSRTGALIRYQVQNDLKDPVQLHGVQKDFVVAALALDVVEVITTAQVVTVV